MTQEQRDSAVQWLLSLNAQRAGKKPLDDLLRRQLHNGMAEDVAKLESICGLPLSQLWHYEVSEMTSEGIR
jgi:hypothetical protein